MKTPRTTRMSGRRGVKRMRTPQFGSSSEVWLVGGQTDKCEILMTRRAHPGGELPIAVSIRRKEVKEWRI